MAERTGRTGRRKRYAAGVEVVTGLAIGAAVVGALVSLMVTIMLYNESRMRSELRASQLISVVSGLVEVERGEPVLVSSPELLRLILSSQGDVAGVAVLDWSSGETLARLDGVHPGPELLGLGDAGDRDGLLVIGTEEGYRWYVEPLPSEGGDLALGIAFWETGIGGSGFWMIYFLGGICVGLVVLAIATPRFLQHRVLEPLQGLLREADKVVEGGGRSADTARRSFTELVDRLAERDKELNELRKRAEERADAAEARATSILSSMRSGIVAVDRVGSILYYNQRAAEILDLRPEDGHQEFPRERSQRLAEVWERVVEPSLSGDGEPEDLELGSDDDEMVLSVTASASPDGGLSVLLTDVTRISHLERRLAEEEAFSRLGLMAAGISHEMGNTLCALSGFIDLLGKGHSDRRTSDLITEARSEVEAAQKMIDAFKSYARPWRIDAALVPVSRVRTRVRAVCDRWADSCELTRESNDVDGTVQIDPDALATCLENVVRNSLEADPSCSVSVAMKREQSGRDREELVLEVRDNGPGLPEDPDVLFRPFFTTHPEDGNTGLGLAVAKRLAEAMGGKIEARSLGGESCGSVIAFRFTLLKEDEGAE
jgi:signal transduction histidine kinase